MPLETDSTLAPSPAAPDSDASKKFFGNLRADVKARLFAQAGATSGPDGTSAPLVDPLATPNRIGRYVVIKRIGAGGMGLVYAAYDDKLDRRVAVKLLRPGHRTTGGRAQERLLREAQAIARLSHRCVIQVYEVGTHEDEVFVAMEYVDGPTLKQWQPSRDWRDILARYRDAGQGLCAAHEAGIVHRDFKADNVLVRPADLAVRVLDFGLARTEHLEDLESTDATAPATTSLTHTGMVMGTPAYMAPEQHLALPTDTRTDQFSFCASLFEALYGYRAFAGETLDELRKNVLDGHIEPAPHYTKVPVSVHRALQRGLAVDPDARHPTMEALLAELEVGEKRRPWVRTAWGLGVATALAAGGLAWSSANADEVTADAERLRTEFDAARRADAEEELRRLEARTLPERWNDLVLAYARAAPGATASLASLKHLTVAGDRWLPAARALANDAHRRGPVFTTLELPSPVTRLAFGGDDSLAAALDDGTLRRWADPTADTTTLTVDGTLVDIALDRDGALHVALLDGRVASFAPGTTRPSLRTVTDTGLTTIACDPDEACAVGTDDGQVMLLTDDQTQTLREHTGAITALAFDPKTRTLASGDTGGRVVAWFLDRDTHRSFDAEVRIDGVAWPSTPGVLIGVTAKGPLAWSPKTGRDVTPDVHEDTRALASAPGVQVLHRPERAWLQFGDDAPTPLDRSELMTSVSMSPRGTWVAGGGSTGVTVWRAGGDASSGQASGHRVVDVGDHGRVVAMHARGDALYGITDAGLLFSIDADDRVAALAEVGHAVDRAVASPDGRSFALRDPRGVLSLAEFDAAAQVRELGQQERTAPGPLVWSADGQSIATQRCEGYERKCVVSVHPRDGSAPSVLGTVEGTSTMLRLADDGSTVAVLGATRVSTWNVSTGQPARFDHPRLANGDRVRPLAMDLHEGAEVRLAVAQSGQRSLTLRVWTMSDETSVVPLFEEPNLRGVVPTSDGRGVVLHTADDRHLLWLLSEDRFRLLPDGTLGALTLETEVHRSPTGTHLWVVRAGQPQAQIIDLQTGQMQRVPHPVAPTAWAPDGSWADVSRLRNVRRWALAPPDSPDAFLAWLDARTRVTMPLEALHVSVAPERSHP
ncbi:MAG: serine/threonine-protein kinase [Myxococcota bacterium]